MTEVLNAEIVINAEHGGLLLVNSMLDDDDDNDSNNNLSTR